MYQYFTYCVILWNSKMAQINLRNSHQRHCWRLIRSMNYYRKSSKRTNESKGVTSKTTKCLVFNNLELGNKRRANNLAGLWIKHLAAHCLLVCP
jgi:hypothetical protein